jgi:Raf kinase inhibitor-like YbhB/YbcL family protein
VTRRGTTLLALVTALALLAGCAEDGERDLLGPGEREPTGMKVTSPAFEADKPVPERFSCEGDNVPPPLRWDEPPRGTSELAVVVEDPDAPRGIFVHWIVVGIKPDTTGMEPDRLPEGARVLPGSSDNAAYVGPCPPDGGGTHRYFFEIYALRRQPDIRDGMGPVEKVRAIRKAASAGDWLVGTFTR